VLQVVAEMPEGGGYRTHASSQTLIDAIRIGTDLRIEPAHAKPSFCSTATYRVLLRTLARLRDAGRLDVPLAAMQPLAPPTSLDSLFQDDGKGLWGRWNANGPGTAVLFHQLGIGTNFTDWSKKRPGDFMKIWSTDPVGKKSGHSVIYLDERTDPQTGTPEVLYFSSGKPDGYARVWEPREKIVHALFAWLTTPENLTRATALPEVDGYLVSLLTAESSLAEAKQQAGVMEGVQHPTTQQPPRGEPGKKTEDCKLGRREFEACPRLELSFPVAPLRRPGTLSSATLPLYPASIDPQ
jgi:hypothetical protein